MIGRKVLLLEPNYKNKYPPMGLMKLATYYRDYCHDDVRFYKGNLKELAALLLCEEFLADNGNKMLRKHTAKFVEYIKTKKSASIRSIDNDFDLNKLNLYHIRFKSKAYPKFDIVCVTTLFTFYWKETIDTINFAKEFCKDIKNVYVGGIAASLVPKHIINETGVRPYIGLLDSPGALDKDSDAIIDHLPLDYSILEEIDYHYPAEDAYYAYMTRGCVNRCKFCAVPELEPKYCGYISLKRQIEQTESRFGAKKDLLLLDNNVFASRDFNKIINEIIRCGFGKKATYTPPSEYEIAFRNLRYNPRGYIRKIVSLYDAISDRLAEK
jgi:hypothetical protein